LSGIWVTLLVFTIILILIGVGWWFTGYFRNRRTDKIKLLAQTNGFTFTDYDENYIMLNELKVFRLFNEGRNQFIENITTANINGIPVKIFDYRVMMGGGKSPQLWRETIAYFESDNLQLPQFYLRPQRFADTFSLSSGRNNIDFKNYPEFKREYLLTGGDEQSIHKLFNEHIIKYFLEHPGQSTEGNGKRLIFHLSKVISVDNMLEFMQQSSEVFTLFKNN
jgi:hypothetical protein